jgi:hypothetical protein
MSFQMTSIYIPCMDSLKKNLHILCFDQPLMSVEQLLTFYNLIILCDAFINVYIE